MSEKKKTLADAGEFEFIKRIKSLMPKDGGDIVRSIGDDCFVAESFGKDRILVTTDTFVEDIHFKMEYSTFEQIGQRCMAASVSDIAAMSGCPVYSFVSLSMRPKTLFNGAVELFNGLQNTAKRYYCPIVGGETTSTKGPLTVTVTVIGKANPDHIILRSGAKIGDSIYVSGFIGDAMAGLMAFDKKVAGFDSLKDKFLLPEAHITLSRALAESYHITSLIDISDGLATDIGNICSESCCGAEIYEELLPLSNDLRRFTKKLGLNITDFAISSGEDFELLFTSDDKTLSEKFKLMNHDITRIGTIVENSNGIKLHRKNGQLETVSSKGYEHYKS